MVLHHARALTSPGSWMRIQQLPSLAWPGLNAKSGRQGGFHGIEVEKMKAGAGSQVGNDPSGDPAVDGANAHAELGGEDFYALSFWYGGCLVGFFSRPYASDFVRHRTRLVTRELAHLLSLLDEPSHDPVQTSPRPD